jgi:hypothetical protein
VFDSANPDLHTPQRSETTVPQQALFFLNHPLPLDRARALAGHKSVAAAATPQDKVKQLYRLAYQRVVPRKDAAILSNCPDPAVRREWIQRIVDHDGTREGEGGIELWIRWAWPWATAEEMEVERHVPSRTLTAVVRTLPDQAVVGRRLVADRAVRPQDPPAADRGL